MNKKLFHRGLCLLLCMLMLCVDTVSALGEEGMSVLTLPQKLNAIEEEAFAGTDDIEKVIVQDGTKRIESRAFAGSGIREIYLPDSVNYIADDAFEGCDNLTVTVERGSDAHKWIAFKGIDYVVAEDETEAPAGKYIISGLKVVPGEDSKPVYSMTVTASRACTLQITCIPEGDEDDAFTTESAIEGNLTGVEYTCEPSGELPAYFMLEACLYDEDGEALCAPVSVRNYTSAYADFISQSTEDFPEERVMDFGESGYAVLAEGVVRVSGARDMGNDRYTFTPVSAFADGASAIPEKGDVLMLDIGGRQTPVKVGAVTINEDGSVTIDADKEITLSDVYSTINLNGYINVSDDSVSGSAEGVINFKKDFEKGAFTANVNCSMSVKVTAQYDVVKWGKDYFKFEMTVRNWGTGNATLKGSFSTDELEDPIEVQLYDGVVIIPGLNVPATMSVTLPMFAVVEGEGTFDFVYDKTIGFSWDSDNGFVPISPEGINSADAGLKVNFDANIGPKVTLGLELLEFFEANIHGQVGLGLEGVAEAHAHMGDVIVDQEKVHACYLCTDLDVYVFGRAGASINYNISEKVKGSLLDEKISTPQYLVLEKYHSYANEIDSKFGGEDTKGSGNCPNYKYPIEIKTMDADGKELTGIPVSIDGGENRSYTGTSPYKRYICEGVFTASAAFESGTATDTFVMGDQAKEVVLEDKISLDVIVQEGFAPKEGEDENYTPISGATVTLILPNGKTKTAYTGAEGTCQFTDLPGGEYTVKAKAEGYKEKSFTYKYTPGTHNKAEFTFEPNKFPYLTASTDSGYVQAKTKDGTCPEYVPKVWVNIKKDSYGFSKYVSLKHQDCAEEFIFRSDNLYGVSLEAANIGTGEYIYILGTYGMRSYSGNYTFIFRVEDGKFQEIGRFASDNASLDVNIGVSGKFTSSTKYEGIIYPSEIKFSGEKKPASNTRKGFSIVCSRMGSTSLVENEEGYYDFIYSQSTYNASYNNDTIGKTCTRFVLDKPTETLVMQEQWFEPYS